MKPHVADRIAKRLDDAHVVALPFGLVRRVVAALQPVAAASRLEALHAAALFQGGTEARSRHLAEHLEQLHADVLDCVAAAAVHHGAHPPPAYAPHDVDLIGMTADDVRALKDKLQRQRNDIHEASATLRDQCIALDAYAKQLAGSVDP